MNNLTKHIRLLNESDSEIVNQLRVKEYHRAKGFNVTPAGIEWNRSDDESIVLGAFIGEELVSTMRMEIVEDLNLLEKKLECPWGFSFELKLPVMILSKASTLNSYRSYGFNTLLRKYCLELAQKWKVHYVVGTFIKNSPRTFSMSKMGYQFVENKQGWTSPNYSSYEPVLVAALDVKKDIDLALNVTNELMGPELSGFLWSGNQPSFKIVRNIS